MIKTTRRLIKLAQRSNTYAEFERGTASFRRWYFSPYINLGHSITKQWLEAFYVANHKAGQ